MRSPCTSRMRELAKPPISAARTFAGSAPALDANKSASPTASIVRATIIWLATLVVWPSPLAPTRVMFLPISSNSGLTLSKAACGPPTMIVSEAALAPTSPPETGASRYSQPSAVMRRAKSLVAIGEMELMSTTILPGVSPSATPLLPNSAASTCGVSGTMVITTSELAATSLPDAQTFAPPPVSSSGTLPRSKTESACPPFSRCPAMGRPMIPRPINPTFISQPPQVPSVSFAVKIGSCPAKPGACAGRRLVFASDPTCISFTVEHVEHEAIIDLARPRLVAAGIVGDLDVSDVIPQAAEGCREFAVHPGLVIDVILQEEIVGPDLLDDRHGLIRACQPKTRDVLVIDRF